MARQPRLGLPGIPRHFVQRGKDRHACFAAEADFLCCLQEPREASSTHDCAIHAYRPMTSHVHLLMAPATPGAITRMMQAVGRRYVGSFNDRCGRTGTAWEGRFKAALVHTDHYPLTCHRYIELNPVSAHLTEDRSEHRWSSYRHKALGEIPPPSNPHEQYTLLPETFAARQAVYRALVDEHVERKHLDDLRRHTQQQRAWGSERFQQQIEALPQRSVSVRRRGRLRKSTEKQD